MTGQLDSILRPIADDLIQTFGKSATLRRIDITHDPITGKPTETTTDYSVIITPPADYSENMVSAGVVERDDLKCSIADLGMSVRPDVRTDHVMFDGKSYTVKDVSPVYSGERVAYYELRIGH